MNGFSTKTLATILSAGAMLLLTHAPALAQPSWLRIGPPRTPEQYLQDERDYRNRVMQPDAGPYPPSSWNWPTLRQALDEYGLFGRRACKNGSTGTNGWNGYSGVIVPAPADTPSSEAAMPSSSTAALIRVLTPPSAKVWFNDSPTTAAGAVRLFSSPPLEADRQYTYVIRAEWLEDSKTISRTRRIVVYAGDRQTVDLRVTEVSQR